MKILHAALRADPTGGGKRENCNVCFARMRLKMVKLSECPKNAETPSHLLIKDEKQNPREMKQTGSRCSDCLNAN